MFTRGVSRRRTLAGVFGIVAVRDAWADAPLRFGTETNDAPFSSVDARGAEMGFSIDIGNEICRRLRVRCVWVGMKFDTLLPAVEAGKIDAALSQITVTPARSEQVLFTEPVTATGGLLIVPELSDITNDPATMKGKTIGVQSGTTHETYARRVIMPVARVRFYPNEMQAFDALADGKIDATLCDMELGHKWLETHAGEFRYADRQIDDPELGSSTAIALHLGNDRLRARIDGALEAMRRDGTYATINRRYFNFSIAPGGFGDPL